MQEDVGSAMNKYSESLVAVQSETQALTAFFLRLPKGRNVLEILSSYAFMDPNANPSQVVEQIMMEIVKLAVIPRSVFKILPQMKDSILSIYRVMEEGELDLSVEATDWVLPKNLTCLNVEKICVASATPEFPIGNLFGSKIKMLQTFNALSESINEYTDPHQVTWYKFNFKMITTLQELTSYVCDDLILRAQDFKIIMACQQLLPIVFQRVLYVLEEAISMAEHHDATVQVAQIQKIFVAQDKILHNQQILFAKMQEMMNHYQ